MTHHEAKHAEAEEAEEAVTAAPGVRRVAGRRSQFLIALLLALLGFALVTQVRLAQGESLSTLRQDDLVRLLDDVTRRGEQLEAERAALLAERAELLTGEDSRRVAEEAAAQRALVQGILAGTVPVEGPGVTVSVRDPGATVRALTLVNMLQELRNAGAEAVEVSGVRLVASSWFADAENGVIVDGTLVTPPYSWIAVGDPQTLAVALDIPGGALAAVRNAGGSATVVQEDLVQVTALASTSAPRFATPVESPSPSP